MYCRRHTEGGADKPIKIQVVHILHTPKGAMKIEVVYCPSCDPARHERILDLQAKGLIRHPKRPIY